MFKKLFAISLIVLSFSAQADLESSWNSWQKKYKGPFGDNVLQGSKGRVSIRNGGSPAGKRQFQAAFRNEFGRDMAQNYDFYTVNLFTTNYYELMGEYVYGDIYGSHEINEAALNAQGAVAIKKAASMVRSWVLEKYYVEKFPNSRLASSFLLRGISDVANETEFANYFFNFFLSNMNDDYQYLTAALLIKESPIVMSSDLESARNIVASEYERIALGYGADSRVAKAYYQIRNAVHNQPTPDTIRLIDNFKDNHGDTEGLRSVRKKLINYFNFSAREIADYAEKIGASAILAAAKNAEDNGVKGLLELSKAAVQLRIGLGTVSYEQKTNSLQLLSMVAQFLNKEVSEIKKVESIAVLETALNSVFIEGFLVYDNWVYFQETLVNSADMNEAGEIMAQVTQIGLITLQEAFEPTLSQWISVEEKMDGFIDGKVKASALGAAGDAIGRIK